MAWSPNSASWRGDVIEVTIEPYRCDLSLPPTPGWPPNRPYSFMAGTSGIIYVCDVALQNRTDQSLVIRFHGRSPPHATSLQTFLALLKPLDELRIRFPFHPGTALALGWADPRNLDPHITVLREPNTALIVEGLESYAMDANGDLLHPIHRDVARNLAARLPWSHEWCWEEPQVWNEIDLLRRSDSSLAVPIEKALAVASQQIISTVRRYPTLLTDVQPQAFETLVAAAFRELGFRVTFSARGADGGVDLFAVSGPDVSPSLHIVQCKRWRKDVGIRVVRELFGVRAALAASKAVLVTTSGFTRPALSFAADHPWELTLVDFERLLSVLKPVARNPD